MITPEQHAAALKDIEGVVKLYSDASDEQIVNRFNSQIDGDLNMAIIIDRRYRAQQEQDSAPLKEVAGWPK